MKTIITAPEGFRYQVESTDQVVRYHDISCGHRVAGHESKCSHLHGHNYRIHFHVQPAHLQQPPDGTYSRGLDNLGRVIDFSVVKSELCMWLEDNWDHKLLLWEEDPMLQVLLKTGVKEVVDSIVVVDFNPTAENMANHLIKLGNEKLYDKGLVVQQVVVEETRKCSVISTMVFTSDETYTRIA